MSARLLVVDDEAGVRAFLRDLFLAEGYRVDLAADAPAARICLEQARQTGGYDLVFSDIMLPGENGIALLREIRRSDPDLPVVLLTGYPAVKTAVEGLRLGAVDYVTKPSSPEELRIVAERVLETRRLKDETRSYQSRISRHLEQRIVAASEGMKEVMSLVQRYAQADAPVLISGESGTGKDLLARAIHHLSPRRAWEFVAVNCSAIAPGLVESELFGHARGSFTGATSRKEGLIAVAHQGTLFLDEIGEVPPSVQPKLLRALQSGEILEVGGTSPRRVDVRVVAASNRRLADEVAAGSFREDLFYRLNVLHLEVPPLRERREDIPPLVEQILVRYQAKHRGSARRVSPAALSLLQSHPWPGNVRELQNAVERALVLASGDELDREDFAFLDAAGPARSTAAPWAGAGPENEYPYRGLTMEEMERQHMLAVLKECGGNHSAAAEVLGIHRTTIWKKLRS